MFLNEQEYNHVLSLLDGKTEKSPLLQKLFQIKFAELARKYQIHPDYHDADNIFVCYETIRDQIVYGR